MCEGGGEYGGTKRRLPFNTKETGDGVADIYPSSGMQACMCLATIMAEHQYRSQRLSTPGKICGHSLGHKWIITGSGLSGQCAAPRCVCHAETHLIAGSHKSAEHDFSTFRIGGVYIYGHGRKQKSTA